MPTPCVVTGNLQTLSGGAVSAGTVRFQLSNIGTGNPLGITGTSLFPQLLYIVQSDATGAFTCNIWGNDNINPANTVYLVTFIDASGNAVGPVQYSITGASLNLNTAIPGNTTSPPVLIGGPAIVSAPLAPQTITGQPLTLTTSAPLIVANLNNIRFANQFGSIAAAYADLPASGGTVYIPHGYTETLAGNLTLGKSNSSLVFLGSATITMGSNQVIGSVLAHGLTIQGISRGSANVNHAPPVAFIYTGTSAAFVFGAASAGTFDLHIERIGIDITGAGNAAQCLQVNRYQNVTLRELTLLGKQQSGITQILFKSDGTGNFNAYQLIDQPYFLGGHICVDFAGPVAGNNQNQIVGGFITANNTTDGIGIFVETGDTNNFLWPDVFSNNIAVRYGANIGGSSGVNVGFIRSEANTTDAQFDSGCTNVTLYTRTAPTVVDSSGNNTNIAAQFPGTTITTRNLLTPVDAASGNGGIIGSATLRFNAFLYALQMYRSAGNNASPDIYGNGTNGLVIGGKADGSGTVLLGATTGLTLSNTAQSVAAGQVGLGATTAASATAGANGAVPAQVAGYLIINVAGTNQKVPYFNV